MTVGVLVSAGVDEGCGGAGVGETRGPGCGAIGWSRLGVDLGTAPIAAGRVGVWDTGEVGGAKREQALASHARLRVNNTSHRWLYRRLKGGPDMLSIIMGF
ncbi:MAG: hypothetical protein A2Z04_05600 [Chloroflexi bacterium RBG_16_57_9]|nr:MAG: hypothetical protein A2Z04_05600 [Chloroflexi bacterium RBG_16_57_9]